MANKTQKDDAVKPVVIAPVDGDTPVAETETPSEETALATTGPMELGAATGEVGASDIQFPTLRIIQKMSENPDKLDEGIITLDNSLLVQDEKGNCRLTFLSLHKYYKEVLPFGAGIPQAFETAEAAIEAGFRIARSKADRDAGVPLVEDAARALVLIEKPANAMERSFPYEIGGIRCTPAIWWIQSTAYKNVAKYIFSKLAFELKGVGLLPAVWRLTTEEVKGSKGVYYVPRIALLQEERSKEFIADVKTELKL